MNDISLIGIVFSPKDVGRSEPFPVSANALLQFSVAGRCENICTMGFCGMQ